MFLIIGYVIVIGSVLGGFMLENGNPLMLWQPAELLIIVGAGLGAFLGAQTRYSGRLLLQSLKRLFRDPGIGREQYLEMLALLFFIFNKMNRDGPLSLEQDIEKPENSAIFGKYPSIAAKPGAVNFIADTLRVYVTTGDQGEIENLMKLDMRVSLEEDLTPAHGITHMAESLPGMGIVAAVMGVVLTMSMINEPPEVLGHHIRAALVGTFTGILFCYGIFGPMGEKLEHFANEEHFYYNAIKEAIAASLRGASPLIAVEYGRRSIPQGHRPTFSEMEEYVREGLMSSAWKVAYADFVTALMAFFLLMWILNMTPPETKEGLASYFAQEALLDASNVSAISNNALINRTDKLDLSESKMSELERSHYLIARKLQTMLMQDGIPQSASGLSADDVGVQLRISNDALFKPGSADFSPVALKVLDGVLGILREYNLYLVIRGHADSEEAVGSPIRQAGELSAARAAAAARYLAERGVAPTRIRAVGYGDTRPLEPGNSEESRKRNRRLEFHFHRPDAMAYSIVY